MADGDTVLVVTVLDLDLDRRLLLVVEAEPIGDVLKLPWSAEGDHLLFSARTARRCGTPPSAAISTNRSKSCARSPTTRVIATPESTRHDTFALLHSAHADAA
jgi:hypothetical protein